MLALMAPVLVSACAGPTIPRPLVPAGDGTLFVSGYHPWWGLDAGVNYPTAQLDQVFLFEWEANDDGTLADVHGWPEAWAPLVQELASQGIGAVPTLTLFGADAFDALFASEEARERLSDQLLQALGLAPVGPPPGWAGSGGEEGRWPSIPEVAGLHLDVEVFDPVRPEARTGFVRFVRALRARLVAAAPGTTLSIFLPGLDPADAYDEIELAAAVDYVVVQGYDLHYRTGPSAGPVGPLEGWGGLNLASVLDRYETLGVAREKILLSLPLYGYEWPVVGEEPGAATRGPGVNLPWNAPAGVESRLPRGREQLARYGRQPGPDGDGAWYRYRADDGWRQGWVDDGASLARKVALVRSRGLAGVAFFPLIYGDAALWDRVVPTLR